VHDHDRHVDELVMADRAVRGLALDDFRTRDRMVVRRRLSRLVQPLGHESDCVVTFVMHHHERAAAAGALEHFKQLPVIQH
jgi:hypothetical protein